MFEKEAIEAFSQSFKLKTSIAPGPFAYPLIEAPRDTSSTAREVEDFMNRALAERGEHSVIYVRLVQHPENPF